MERISLDYTDLLDGQNEKKVLEFSADLLPQDVNRDSLFVIRVDGASMEPKIRDRALVVADLSRRELEDGGVYLVYEGERLWIKQASNDEGCMRFISVNPAFAHLVYTEEQVRVVAKAVLSFNRL